MYLRILRFDQLLLHLLLLLLLLLLEASLHWSLV
jgi:hypothetical protein